mgnify:CR=1 FL=1|tara:strand:+ start:14973 stop:15458 length:486 start_codon:yes stop_codon:yes gene_type:complete
MMDVPIEIIFKIYTYGGANIFYLNKEGLKYIQNLRLQFLKNPILMYYTIKEYEKRIIFSNRLLSSNNWKVRIIGKNVSGIHTIKLWRGKIGKYTFNKNEVSFNLYNSFKERIISKSKLVKKDYFNNENNNIDQIIMLDKRYDINDIWCYDNRLFKYIELWG